MRLTKLASSAGLTVTLFALLVSACAVDVSATLVLLYSSHEEGACQYCNSNSFEMSPCPVARCYLQTAPPQRELRARIEIAEGGAQ